MAFTPDAVAMSQSPSLILLEAKWVATNEDEQAVLVGTHGPVRPKVYDILPAKKARPLPVTVYALPVIPCFVISSGYSSHMHLSSTAKDLFMLGSFATTYACCDTMGQHKQHKRRG